MHESKGAPAPGDVDETTIPEAAFGNAIAALRAELGLTQAQFAHRLYVTRQCASRWETGETQPGIDMVKLICVEFGTSLERFFNMPANHYCQCCGMPLPTPELRGTEADGLPSQDYCAWCFESRESCGSPRIRSVDSNPTDARKENKRSNSVVCLYLDIRKHLQKVS